MNERTVRGWCNRLGCPILRGCRAFPGRTKSSAPFTSNYLLLAWAISLYRSGGMDKPRFEGRGVPKTAAREVKVLVAEHWCLVFGVRESYVRETDAAYPRDRAAPGLTLPSPRTW